MTITFTAFDGGGQAICFFPGCTTEVQLVVPAVARANFAELVGLFSDCDRVARIEITKLQSESVA